MKNVAATEDAKEYQRVHVTFQSTSSCNMSSVNSLGEVKTHVKKKERGIGVNKRTWAIEMNDGRCFYLGMCNMVDVLDHFLKNAHCYCRSWKYWHMADLHGKCIADCVAWDVYREACEGKLDPTWHVEEKDRLGWWEFRDKLSIQLLRYKPSNNVYPGDNRFRSFTITNKRRRRLHSTTDNSTSGTTRSNVSSSSTVNLIQFNMSNVPRSRRHTPRLCGNLDRLEKHLKSVVKKNGSGGFCDVCGKRAYVKCMLCDKHVHYFPQKGTQLDQTCFIKLHNESYFGLTKSDCSLICKKTSDFKPPTTNAIVRNAKYIEKLKSSDK